MLNNVCIMRYYPTTSFLHNRNCATKILCSFILFLSLFFVKTPSTLLFVFLLLSFLTYLSKVPIPVYLKMLLGGKYFYIALFFLYLICGVNILNSVIMVMRIVFMMLITFLLTLTTSPSEITYGLEKIFSPLENINIDIRGLSFSISLALRFIPMILEEADTVLKSLKSRGMNYRTLKWKDKIRMLKAFLIPVFSITLRNADTLADAMEVRLYNVHASRTNYHTTVFGFKDMFMLVFSILVLASFVLKEMIL